MPELSAARTLSIHSIIQSNIEITAMDSSQPHAASHGHHDDQQHHHHHGGLGKYGVVFLCLCGLTLCSFMTVTESWPLAKTPTWIFMMAVSTCKAMLVIMVFMHLFWEANWKYVLTIPAAMMSLFLVLMLIPDVGSRSFMYSEERKAHAASPVDSKQTAERASHEHPAHHEGDDHSSH